MFRTFRSFFSYFVLGLFIAGLVAVNYYREYVYFHYPFFAPIFILGFSVICSFVIALALWRKNQEIEKERYEFVSIATHKFRTPLSGIKWSADRLATELTHEEKEGVLKQLRNAVDRLIEIVDLLVNFAKIDSHLEFAFGAASLREMVQEAMVKFGPMIKEKNIRFNITADQNMPLIVIDKLKIQFVVDVLIDNALKYTPANGFVIVEIKKTDKAILLAVRDSGIGMSWTERRNLFKKFFRGKNAKTADTEGMGLGLYAAKQIVDRHGGRLWAESEGLTKGSTFYLELKLGKNYRN